MLVYEHGCLYIIQDLEIQLLRVETLNLLFYS